MTASMKTTQQLREERDMRQRSAMIACLKNIWNQREEFNLGDIEEEIKDILYEVGVDVCIAEDVGIDECRCEECLERWVDYAEHLRDVEKEG